MHSARLAEAGAQLASIVSARRVAPATARRRIETAPEVRKRKRVEPLGPTPERLAKGDILRVGGVPRSVPPIKRLLDQGKLSSDPRIALALYRAAEELQAHFAGAQDDLTALDMGRIGARSRGASTLLRVESRAFHHDRYREACRVMGWYDIAPHQGNGRIVVAVACGEMSLGQAASQFLPAMRSQLGGAVVMDRLREGLFALAAHWRFL